MSGRKSTAQSRAEDRILQITSGVRSTPARRPANDKDVYRQLLTEASDPSDLNGPPVKRRRVGTGRRAGPATKADAIVVSDGEPGSSSVNPQTIIDSGESEESDFEWEEAGIDLPNATTSNATTPNAATDDDVPLGDVSFEVSASRITPTKTKRRGMTAADRKLAIAVHKTHVLLLLFNAFVRNAWCSLSDVQIHLRAILSARVVKLLHPDSAWIQLRQSDSFLEGLKEAASIWQSRFKITVSGMHKARWAETPEEVTELYSQIEDQAETIDKAGFIQAAKTLRGSQDLGGQLFCALMRAVGVEARLICSLQPLPLSFAGSGLKTNTPSKEKFEKLKVYAFDESEQDTTSAEDSQAKSLNGSKTPTKPTIGRATRSRLGTPSFGNPNIGGPVGNYTHKTESTIRKKKIQKLAYPIFWTEVLNPAYDRWIAVDPIVTGLVSKAAKFEPPSSCETNALSYVIAFEDDGVAKDVTRRYAKAPNAKTRKLRVESIERGQRWFNEAIKLFKRREVLDRDQIEDVELSKAEAREGLPKNIQDFKDHPHYALERHLKRNEVIWPQRLVGKINVGKSSTTNLEPIYRRNDVQIVQSADKWYRVGREIRQGEQPMKRVPARSVRRRSLSVDSDEESALTGLYAYSQTEPYIPPPAYQGRIPKNAFGNIDVYVPSMVPAGAVHIKHAMAKKAAQLLGVDFADAVTGFQFKGRQGTAVVQGVVVALEYMDAVQSVIVGFEQSIEQEEDDLRTLESLRLWRRFLLGLQIARRIGLTDIYAANDEKANDLRKELDEAEDEREEVFDAGGFFPDAGADQVAVPTSNLIKELQPRRNQLQTLEQSSVTSQDGEMTTEIRRPVRRKRRMVDDDDDEDHEQSYDPQTQYRPDATTARSTEVIETNNPPADTPDQIETRRNDVDTVPSPLSMQDKTPVDDGVGGGFIAEEHPVAETELAHEQEGGFMVEDGEHVVTDTESIEIEQDATVAEQAFDSDKPAEASNVNTPQVYHEVVKQLEPKDVVMVNSTNNDGQGRSEESDDRGSLLSHDPEDEDADPDWL